MEYVSRDSFSFPRQTLETEDDGGTTGVYKTTDRGFTWTELTEGLPKVMGKIGVSIRGVLAELELQWAELRACGCSLPGSSEALLVILDRPLDCAGQIAYGLVVIKKTCFLFAQARRSLPPLALGMFLGSSLVFAAVADEPAGEPALERCFREPATVVRTLPPEVVWATDVRWVDDHRVVLASNVFGIFELDLGDASVPPKRIVEAGPRKSAAWAPTAVAISKEHVAWAAVAFAIGWMPLGDEEALVPIGREYFEMASDLDLRGQKVAVLGLRKSEVPRSYEANGAFVWTGTLGDEGLTDLRPLAFAGDGAPAQQLNDCMNFHFGDLRFLGDGSLVAVPISEPGVFLFAPDGTLRRTWTSDELDIHGGCKLTMREADDLAISPEMRKDWINQRRLVDDVVPFGNGDFGLLIREYDAGTTHWTLLRLSADGSERQQCLLHEEPDGAWIRLEADYHDGKLVLLRRPKLESKRAIREGSQEPTVLWVGRYE